MYFFNRRCVINSNMNQVRAVVEIRDKLYVNIFTENIRMGYNWE